MLPDEPLDRRAKPAAADAAERGPGPAPAPSGCGGSCCRKALPPCQDTVRRRTTVVRTAVAAAAMAAAACVAAASAPGTLKEVAVPDRTGRAMKLARTLCAQGAQHVRSVGAAASRQAADSPVLARTHVQAGLDDGRAVQCSDRNRDTPQVVLHWCTSFTRDTGLCICAKRHDHVVDQKHHPALASASDLLGGAAAGLRRRGAAAAAPAAGSVCLGAGAARLCMVMPLQAGALRRTTPASLRGQGSCGRHKWRGHVRRLGLGLRQAKQVLASTAAAAAALRLGRLGLCLRRGCAGRVAVRPTSGARRDGAADPLLHGAARLRPVVAAAGGVAAAGRAGLRRRFKARGHGQQPAAAAADALCADVAAAWHALPIRSLLLLLLLQLQRLLPLQRRAVQAVLGCRPRARARARGRARGRGRRRGRPLGHLPQPERRTAGADDLGRPCVQRELRHRGSAALPQVRCVVRPHLLRAGRQWPRARSIRAAGRTLHHPWPQRARAGCTACHWPGRQRQGGRRCSRHAGHPLGARLRRGRSKGAAPAGARVQSITATAAAAGPAGGGRAGHADRRVRAAVHDGRAHGGHRQRGRVRRRPRAPANARVGAPPRRRSGERRAATAVGAGPALRRAAAAVAPRRRRHGHALAGERARFLCLLLLLLLMHTHDWRRRASSAVARAPAAVIAQLASIALAEGLDVGHQGPAAEVLAPAAAEDLFELRPGLSMLEPVSRRGRRRLLQGRPPHRRITHSLPMHTGCVHMHH